MPRRCVFNCEPSDVPMHRFPNVKKFPEVFKSWVKLAGGKLESTSDYEYYKEKRVCDIHFTERDKRGIDRLFKEAIPSLHIPGSSESPVIIVEQEQPEMPSCTTASHTATSFTTSAISTSAIPTSTSNVTVKDVLLEHNYTAASRARWMSNLKPGYKTVQPLQRKIKQLRSEVSRLRKKGQLYKTRLRNAEIISDNVLFQRVVKNMTKPAQLFVHMQLQTSKKAKGRRYSVEEKVLALSLFKKSPKCYSLLSKYFTLPSSKSMKRLLSQIKISPGINPVIFAKIKEAIVDKLPSDRLCSLMFDEMSLQPQILYNVHEDRLEGFACNEEANFADHVLVFMVKGVKQNYKQPIAYYFTNRLKKMQLKSIIKTVVKHAQDAGLIILNLVCDQCTVNVGAITELLDDTKKLFLRHGKEWRHDVIRLNGQNIIPIFDAPHLIKGIRNNLLTKNMIYSADGEQQTVKWEYYQKVYAADKSFGELRLLDKLTEEHINPEKMHKMRVKLATQLLSHSVAVATEHLAARGEIPAECRQLIKITLLLDNVFDSLNISSLHVPNGKIYKGPIKMRSPHHQLWQTAKKILATITFTQIKKVGNKTRLIETTVPSVQNLIKTIKGMEAIWKVLNEKYGFDAFLTRNLNQDPLENFFGNIRSYGARNNTPNTVAFEGAFKALLLNNYNSPHSNRANCEEDINKCLHSLEFYLNEKTEPVSSNATKEDDIYINENILNEPQTDTDAGQRNYVCGWVLTKCLKNIVKSCKNCRKDIIDSGTNTNNDYIKRKEYSNKKWLCYPSQDLETSFHHLQNIVVGYLKKNVPKENLKKNIIALADILISYPFQCDVHKQNLKTYFVNTTINVLVCSWCRSINRILTGKIIYDGEDEVKTAAQLYYNSSCKRNKKH